MSEGSTSTGFLMGLVVGAAIGLAVGFLYAPQPGEETREVLREKVGDVKEKAAAVVGRVKETAASVRRRGAES